MMASRPFKFKMVGLKYKPTSYMDIFNTTIYNEIDIVYYYDKSKDRVIFYKNKYRPLSIFEEYTQKRFLEEYFVEFL